MSSEGNRVASVMSRVQDDLRAQAQERWRSVPDSALLAFVWHLELRQWDLQVEVSAEDDALQSAKLRGAINEIQNLLDSVTSEAIRRRLPAEQKEVNEDE